MTWRREVSASSLKTRTIDVIDGCLIFVQVSYFAGQSFKYRDADRSRFLDLLVSKRKSKKKRVQPSKQSSQVRQRQEQGGRFRQLSPRAEERQSVATKRTTWEPSGRKMNVKTSNPTIQASTRNSNRQREKSDTTKRIRRRTGSQSNEFEARRRRAPSSRVRGKERIGMSTRAPEPPPQLDSTMFFPVGSPVSHKFHGRGTVLEPPTGDAEFSEKMRVRVDFNGVEWDMDLDQISHVY